MSLNKMLNQYQIMPLSIGQEANDITYSKEDIFQKKLNELLNNIVSNGKMPKKEKLLKQAIYEIASTPQGREVISGLPNNIKINMFSFTDVLKNPAYWSSFAGYSMQDNRVVLKASLIKGNPSKTKGLDLKAILIHELRHAYQYALVGASMNVFHTMSPKEIFKQNKLEEAETRAWFKTNLMCERILGHWGNPSKEKISAFMKRDLVVEKKKLLGFLPNPFFNEHKLKQSPVYILQQALRNNNGDIHAAQKYLVGTHITRLMRDKVDLKDKAWQFIYNGHSLLTAYCLSRFYVKNNSIYEQFLKRYQSEYSVKREEIDRIGMGKFRMKDLDFYQKRFFATFPSKNHLPVCSITQKKAQSQTSDQMKSKNQSDKVSEQQPKSNQMQRQISAHQTVITLAQKRTR